MGGPKRREAPTSDPYASGVCPYGEDWAPGAGCLLPKGHAGPHCVADGDAPSETGGEE